MDYWKIKQCIREKLEAKKERISDRAEARTIGMSQRGYLVMMEKETMSIKKLEELATQFNKPVSYFFSTDKNYDTESTSPYNKEDKCTDPVCLDEKKTLEDENRTLLNQVVQLQQEKIKWLEDVKGNKHNGKSNEGDVEESISETG